MAISLLSAPPVSHRTSFYGPYPPIAAGISAQHHLIKFPIKRTTHLSSSPSPSSVVEDDPTPLQSESNELPFRGCGACGKEEVERGCNGEGRMQGGIATVPGFGWWPIKAYRPCPGFLASGGRYKRQGQSMDEVAFGRAERVSSSESQPSKKKDGTRRFKS